ncbi:MAG TPA: hypothetical protein VLH19_05560 [Patescibacteria group bacterium]|nr:hypothetical protein [Patescibacteria group bacterium]
MSQEHHRKLTDEEWDKVLTYYSDKPGFSRMDVVILANWLMLFDGQQYKRLEMLSIVFAISERDKEA